MNEFIPFANLKQHQAYFNGLGAGKKGRFAKTIYILKTHQDMNMVPQQDPSRTDNFFVDLSSDQREGMKNSHEKLGLFQAVKRYVEKGDKDAAIRSLKNIINRPGLESWHYSEACHFLNKLFAFSEKYFDLYGIRFESRN